MSITVGRGALAAVNLVIAQGADNAFSFRYSREVGGVLTPVDLSEYSARAQIRERVGGDVFLDLVPVLTSAGLIEVSIPAAVTEAEEWNGRLGGVWDLELVDPVGGVVRFAEGTVRVLPDVTRV